MKCRRSASYASRSEAWRRPGTSFPIPYPASPKLPNLARSTPFSVCPQSPFFTPFYPHFLCPIHPCSWSPPYFLLYVIFVHYSPRSSITNILCITCCQFSSHFPCAYSVPSHQLFNQAPHYTKILILYFILPLYPIREVRNIHSQGWLNVVAGSNSIHVNHFFFFLRGRHFEHGKCGTICLRSLLPPDPRTGLRLKIRLHHRFPHL